jgi:hypothetical protein
MLLIYEGILTPTLAHRPHLFPELGFVFHFVVQPVFDPVRLDIPLILKNDRCWSRKSVPRCPAGDFPDQFRARPVAEVFRRFFTSHRQNPANLLRRKGAGTARTRLVGQQRTDCFAQPLGILPPLFQACAALKPTFSP